MSADEPTNGEVWRKLEDLTQELAKVVIRLERRDTYVEENFVRRQVWVEARRADQGATANLQQDIGGFQKQAEVDRAWRRQLNLAVGVALLGGMLSTAVQVVSAVSK